MGWKETATEKREAIRSKIPKDWLLDHVPSPQEQKDVTGDYVQQFLSSKEREITESDAVAIVDKTSNGSWTCVEVAKAFCHRAAIAHQLLNCLHEIFFDAALQDAEALDEKFAKNKQAVGPLHGLPVSLKDQFHIKGVETTMGYVGWVGTYEGKKGTGKEKVSESLMAQELRELGAVLYCKTSVPMTLMSGETVNNIVGYTLNPKNRLLSAGGSSGGEGALIGFRGSPVGMGTDIGGSIRIPAGFNGLYGLRPSAGRLPYEGMANSFDGQNSVLSVVGPLGTTSGSLRLVTKSILSLKPWLHDPLVIELPWRDSHEALPQRFTVGILAQDDVVRPSPPVRRAVALVKNALEGAGHKTVDWTPPSHAELNETGYETWKYDGGLDAHTAFKLSGEDPIPQVSMFGSGPVKQYEASDIARVNVRKRQLQKEYMEYWNETGVDFVVSPIAPYPAARRELYKYYGYTLWVNVLDYTSVAVPVTLASKVEDPADEGYQAKNEDDRAAFEAYDPEIYDGAHVSLQVVGRRLQEERMIAVAEYVGKLLHT